MTKSDNVREREEEKLECSLPVHPALISTPTPEEEIWREIDSLTNYRYVCHLLNLRARGKYFHKFRQHIRDKLLKSKKKHNQKAKNDKEKVYEYELLNKKDDIERNSEEITILAKQAIELYKSSQIASIYAKPILLYYSYTKLEAILFLATYRSVDPTGGHGLWFNLNNKSIICQTDGTFVRFHDSYNWNPSIYLNRCIFRWHDLLLNEKTKISPLIYNMKRGNIVRLNEIKSGSNYREHELTREIIFTYAMSMLARYHAKDWNEIIEGKQLIKDVGSNINIIWKIQEYLKSTQLLFPNLIFNQIHGRQFYFYPSEPDYMSLSIGASGLRKREWIL